MEVRIKNRRCYYFDDTIILENSDIDNTLINETSHENILIYDISCITLIGSKHLRLRFDKIDGFIRVHDRTRYSTHCLALKNTVLLTRELDIL